MAKITRKNLNIILLFLILALAIFFRVWRLSEVPSELFGDELDVGYQAYSLLKTGQDLHGNSLPIYIQSLAEFRAPLFIYSTVPFVAIFGLTELGVRFTAVFWGILGIAALYFLTKKLFNSEFLSLLSCLLLAISPWHLQYSRAGFEVTLLLFLLTVGTWSFLRGLERQIFLILAGILFALTPYTYSTATVFMPLFILSLIIIYRQQIRKLWQTTSFKSAVFIFLVILLPFLWQIFFGQAGLRFSQINIFTHPKVIQDIVESRSIDQSGGVIFHNKALSALFEISRNYLWSFSPQFLFTDGDPIGRHSVGKMGEFHWFQLPLMLIFLILLIKGKVGMDKKSLAVLVTWLILSPIPASLTYEGTNNATRLILFLPPLTIISAFGLIFIYRRLKVRMTIRYLIFLFFGIVALINLATYFHRYYVHYPKESWRSWQVGYREVFAYIKEHESQYKTIIINNTYEPALIRFLFYMKYDPAQFHQKFTGDKMMPEISRGIDGFKLDKFYFGELSGGASGLGAIATVLTPETLYLASAREDIGEKLYLGVESEKIVKVLKTVNNYLGEPIFYIVTVR